MDQRDEMTFSHSLLPERTEDYSEGKYNRLNQTNQNPVRDASLSQSYQALHKEFALFSRKP